MSTLRHLRLLLLMISKGADDGIRKGTGKIRETVASLPCQMIGDVKY